MSSIFIYGNTFEKVYSIFILISNSTTLILSLLLIITNIVKENNKNISLMLSINYQIGVVCILHSISFILYPFNNKEDTTIVTIEGTLAIISSLVIINLVGSLLIFEYVLLKEEIRKRGLKICGDAYEADVSLFSPGMKAGYVTEISIMVEKND